MGRNQPAISDNKEPSAAEQLAAGVGGSYSIDKRGNVALEHRTESVMVSRKAPLMREGENGQLEEVPAEEAAVLSPVLHALPSEAPAAPAVANTDTTA